MRFLSVFSVLFLVRLSSCDEVVFDLSSPDPSLARDYKSTVDGVVHHSFFSTGLFFSKVVDGGVTLWEAEGEERCDVLFTSVCDRTRAVLHVWVKGLPSKTLHYENVGGEWKLVTVRVKGLPELEEPVSPKEHAAELNFANLGCPLQGFSGAEVPSHDEDLGELDEYVPEAPVKEESKQDAPELPTEDVQPEEGPEEESSNEKEELGDLDDKDSGETLVEELQPEVAPAESPEEDLAGSSDKESESDDMGDPSKENEQEARAEETMLEGVTSEDEEPKASEPPKNAEKNVAPTHSQVLEKGEHVSHGLGKSTAGGASLDNIASNHSEVKQESPKKHLQGTSPKDTPKAPTQPVTVQTNTKPVQGAQKQVAQQKPQQSSQQPATNLQGGAKKEQDEAKEQQPAAKPVTLSERAKKVDTKSFDVRESSSNGVPLLICTPKSDVVVTELKYGDETIWNNSRGSCLSALIHFKGEKPYVVTVQYRENEEEHVIFLHYNGEEWEHNKGEHEKKLNALKGLPTPQSAEQVNTTPITLDLAHPDRSKVSMNDQSSDVMNIMEYTPKDGYHISSVFDGEVEVWTCGTGETSGLVNSYTKGDSSLITIGVDKGDDLEHKHFEKVDGKWSNVSKRYFEHRLHSMKDFSASAGERLGELEDTLPQAPMEKEEDGELQNEQVADPQESGSDHSESSMTHPDEQSETGEPTEVASVEQEEQDTAPADSQPDANTETNEVEPLNETESSQEVASPSQCEEDLEDLDEALPETKVEHETHIGDFSESKPEEVTSEDEEESKNVVIGSATSTEPKEVTEDNPNKPSGDNAAEPVESESNPITVDTKGSKPQVLTESNEKEPEVSIPEESSNKGFLESADLLETHEGDDSDSKELKESESVPTPTAESPKDHLRGDTDSSQPPLQPASPVADLKSKVDASLFDLEEGQENGFKVLKLTAKEGTSTNKLTFDGKDVWKAQNAGDSCSVATFYLGEKEPVGALYRFKRENDGKTVEGYRQFSGGKWIQVRGDVFRKLIGKDEPVTTSKEPSTNEGAKDKPTTTSSSTPIILDISAHQDTTECRIFSVNFLGVPTRSYSPKLGHLAKEVKDGDESLWKASGTNERCLSCDIYTKNGNHLLSLFIKDGDKSDYKHFEKTDGKWVEIKDFFKKLDKMRGFSSHPSLSKASK